MKTFAIKSNRTGKAQSLRVPDQCIPCGLLAKAVGYPHQYTAAERVLERHDWFYSIGYDAWISPVVVSNHLRTLSVEMPK